MWARGLACLVYVIFTWYSLQYHLIFVDVRSLSVGFLGARELWHVRFVEI